MSKVWKHCCGECGTMWDADVKACPKCGSFNDLGPHVAVPQSVASQSAPALPDTFTLRTMMPEELHPATKALVFNFACALAEKLHAAEQKYGYSDGWLADDWLDECRAKLREHVEKGDPRDVAAYCAFLWHHKASTAGSVASSTRDFVLVPREATAEMVQAAEDRHVEGASYISENSIQFALWREVWRAMLMAAPKP